MISRFADPAPRGRRRSAQPRALQARVHHPRLHHRRPVPEQCNSRNSKPETRSKTRKKNETLPKELATVNLKPSSPNPQPQACSRKKPSLYACSFYMAYCWAPYPSIHTGIFIGAASSGIGFDSKFKPQVSTIWWFQLNVIA